METPTPVLLMLGKLDGKMDSIMAVTSVHSERLNRVEERNYLLSSEIKQIEAVLKTQDAVLKSQQDSKKGMWALIASVGALASGLAGLAKSLGFI